MEEPAASTPSDAAPSAAPKAKAKAKAKPVAQSVWDTSDVVTTKATGPAGFQPFQTNAVEEALGVSRGVNLQPNRASVVAARALSSAPHTAEFWIRVPRTSGRVGILLGIGYPHADQRGSNHSINFELHEQGRARIWWDSGAVDWKSNTDLRTGEWTHLAFVVNAERTEAAVYVDGAEKDRKAATFADIVPLKPPRIGGDEREGDGVGNVPPQFEVAMVRLWSRPLSVADLSAYRKVSPEEVPTEGLMLHYAFRSGEDTDARMVDLSPQGNDGSIVGGRALEWSTRPLVFRGQARPPPVSVVQRVEAALLGRRWRCCRDAAAAFLACLSAHASQSGRGEG